MSRRRMYSTEEAYAFLASSSGSDSGEELLYLPSSSSSSTDSDEEPPRHRPRPGPSTSPSTNIEPGPSAISEWAPASNFIPNLPEFVATAGIRVDTVGLKEADFFQLFFSEELINLIVEETNRYAEQFIAANPQAYHARPYQWTPTNALELKTFFALLFNMGIVKKPTIRSYWSNDMLYHTPLYRSVMPRNRFEALLKFLHYANNENCPPPSDPNFDRIYKIRPLVNYLNQKFSEVYTPEKEIAVDESLVHFKGRLHFRQYLPNKRARYGVKLYKLCEGTTGYTHKFRVYEGKDSKIEPPECPPVLKTTGKIVWDLVHPLLDQGYNIYLDNFYTSVPLLQCLFAKGTVACGTIRRNQRDLPKIFVRQKLKKGESKAVCKDNMMLVKYQDKRDVLVLTTLHPDRSTPVQVRGTTESAPKPVCIQDYNKFMGGVDLSDQALQPYTALRKTKTWYKKLALHLFQITMYNSFVVYKRAGNTCTYLQFQENVIKDFLFGDPEGEESRATGSENRIVPGQHFPAVVPRRESGSRQQKRCRVCSKRGIRKCTIYHCETCPHKPGLCIEDCFKIYHTTYDI
ncbi:piggyBac transposable element-derived protein 4-like [Hyla sarda]|uniref:piggyBac transposable element-derived protein 4-like n=1 Tax=Hyla sarda TaxID=327740 RepID=UPI0024C3EC6F|nr:piggyBac transposable element-derived protein 4-like [Hyla sarda]